MSYTGDSTFAGVSFLVDDSGPLETPIFGRRSRRNVSQSATGGRVVIQVTGQEVSELRLRLTVLDAVWPSLLAKVGTSGTLAVNGQASVGGVYLDALDPVTRDTTNGLVFADATFLGVR